MPDLNIIIDQLKATRESRIEKESELTGLRAKLQRLEAEIDALQRTGRYDDQANSRAVRVKQEHADLQNAIKELSKNLVKNRLDYKQFADDFKDAAAPEVAINLFSQEYPILLLPVRIETKFRKEEKQLWVRIYPDDIAIETNEPQLTEEEFEAGKQYYRDYWMATLQKKTAKADFHAAVGGESRAAEIMTLFLENQYIGYYEPAKGDPFGGRDPQFKALQEVSDLTEEEYSSGCEYFRSLWNAVELHKAAWRELAEEYDPPRAAWINRVFKDDGYIKNWPPGPGDGDEPEFEDIANINLRPESWSAAPRSNVMPDRFAVRLYRSEVLFSVDQDPQHVDDLNNNRLPETMQNQFDHLSDNLTILKETTGDGWQLLDRDEKRSYRIRKEDERLTVYTDLIKEVLGEPVPHPLIVGPAPYPVDEHGLLLFSIELEGVELSTEDLRDLLQQKFESRLKPLSDDLHITEEEPGIRWTLIDRKKTQTFTIIKEESTLNVYSENEMFDEESAWITDFNRAVQIGMGFRIDITEDDFTKGFTRVIVLGIKASINEQQGQEYLKWLIEAHHYSGGFSFVPQGTPTNNTESRKSEFSSVDSGYGNSYDIEFGEPLIGTDGEYLDKDGYRVARALGIDWGCFNFIQHADLTEYADAKYMQTALWLATWGYFLREMMRGSPLDNNIIEKTRDHFIGFVRARGPLPAIRVDTMPYGILPTTAYSRWHYTESPLEVDDAVLPMMNGLLQQLYIMWKGMAVDPEFVPRAGGSNDPEKELVRMLGMEANSHTCRVRPGTIENYIQTLLYYLLPELTGIWLPAGLDERLMGSEMRKQLDEWWKKFTEMKKDCNDLLHQFGMSKQKPIVARTVPWGPGYDIDVPLIQEPPITENVCLKSLAEFEDKNYIQWLHDTYLSPNVTEIDAPSEHPSNTLLYNLLWYSSVLMFNFYQDQDREQFRELLESSFTHISRLSTASLKRLLTETLDLSTNRLDAWITSLVWRRLDNLRSQQGLGIFLGAFGWVENLKPMDDEVPSGGFIHGPSVSHANTAAVLRSAYLSHAGKENAEVMAVNLTSERVRRANWLLDGIRQGQSLSALLGYQFERGLHENYCMPGGEELDQYIRPFRNLYPLNAGMETKLQEGETAETVAARNVVDGLKLLDAWHAWNEKTQGAIPFGQADAGGTPGLPAEGTNAYEAIARELDSLDDSLDALGDLGLAESVYQSVQSNYDRAGALLDAIAGNGRPPEPDVIRTPRGGISLKHRIAVVFTGDTLNRGNWPETPRGREEPRLDKWVAIMLGDPKHIKCRVRLDADGAGGAEPQEVKEFVSIDDINKTAEQRIGPLDFLYLSTSLAMGEATELEQRIAYCVRKEKGLEVDKEVTIDFIPSADWNGQNGWQADTDKSFPDILELSRRMLELISNARYLKPTDLHLPQEADEATDVDFSDDLYYTLEDRINTIQAEIRGLAANLDNEIKKRIPQQNYDNIRNYLLQISQYGIEGTVPESAIEDFAPLFSVGPGSQTDLDNRVMSQELIDGFANNVPDASENFEISLIVKGDEWTLTDSEKQKTYAAVRDSDDDIYIYEHALYSVHKNLLARAHSAIKGVGVRLKACDEAFGYLFSVDAEAQTTSDLNAENMPAIIAQGLKESPENFSVSKKEYDVKWLITDNESGQTYFLRNTDGTIAIYQKAQSPGEAVQQAADGMKALFGKGFTVLPQFTPKNKDELGLALAAENTNSLLDGEDPRWPILWMQQTAQTRSNIKRFENIIMLGEALAENSEFKLNIGQLPHKAGDRWLALPFKEGDDSEKPQGSLSLVAHIPGEFKPNELFAGLVVDDWDEIIPSDTEDTAIAYHFNQPNTEAPQTLLLAVPPVFNGDNGNWKWEDLAGAVTETLDMAKVRAVDLDALKKVGCLLPALFLPINIAPQPDHEDPDG